MAFLCHRIIITRYNRGRSLLTIMKFMNDSNVGLNISVTYLCYASYIWVLYK